MSDTCRDVEPASENIHREVLFEEESDMVHEGYIAEGPFTLCSEVLAEAAVGRVFGIEDLSLSEVARGAEVGTDRQAVARGAQIA